MSMRTQTAPYAKYPLRLLRLADLLLADAKNKKGVKFDLGTWAQRSVKRWGDDPGFPAGTKEIPVDCHTTACAMGLAAISGAFKDEGLSFKLIPSVYNEGRSLIPTLGKLEGFEAAMELFGITYHQACFLFDAEEYEDRELPTEGAKGEKVVAQRIRDFVSTLGVSFMEHQKRAWGE